jgi:hypothetical protein
MILGYLWFERLSLLTYDHPLAIVSSIASGVAFLIPALFVRSPLRQILQWPARYFDTLIVGLLLLAFGTVLAGAAYNFKLVGLSEMYKLREQIQFPLPLRYGAGIVINALLPFAFAFCLERRLYPITLTKLTLLAPFWLLLIAALSGITASRAAVILSLLLPMAAGLAALIMARAGLISADMGLTPFAIVNSRMIAMPSIAMEVYNNFFATHPLTYFCQITLAKLVASCPYDQPISELMKGYDLGAFNASLFATEGIASVGLKFAPLSALMCGLIIGFANRLSAGLPARFVLVSGGILPLVLLNVPLSTNLLSNGVALLFVLWYVTPRSIFEKG